MRLSIRPATPCSVSAISKNVFKCCTTIAQPRTRINQKATTKSWEPLLLDTVGGDFVPLTPPSTTPVRLNKRWMEYQGVRNWEGLLDPLDDNLRKEIIRYGHFVEAAYRAFNFDPSSPDYAKCRYTKKSILQSCGFRHTGYKVTKNLRATSGVQLPRWLEKAPAWVGMQSSWIGYVAVSHDKDEIARLGRRDVVISLRGTATCLEWLENLRANLTPLPNADSKDVMVESGFLSLYTSRSSTSPSLQDLIRDEITRIIRMFGDQPLSFTITGHSLGAALATLAAYDIKTYFKHTPLVTVISFGGPRVGNRSFRCHLEKQGTKVLRIVNSDDLITKVPGFVIEETSNVSTSNEFQLVNLSKWIKNQVSTQWVYADVGRELRLSSKDCPHLNNINIATCHDLKTYLQLVDGFVSSTCPFRATARKMLHKTTA